MPILRPALPDAVNCGTAALTCKFLPPAIPSRIVPENALKNVPQSPCLSWGCVIRLSSPNRHTPPTGLSCGGTSALAATLDLRAGFLFPDISIKSRTFCGTVFSKRCSVNFDNSASRLLPFCARYISSAFNFSSFTSICFFI